jgi:branched-chain amino acid transport system substrate-binding protein
MGADVLFATGFIDDLGADAEGVMATFVGFSVEDLGEAGQDFARRYEERFGQEPMIWSILAYDAMGIALAAIEQAGQADRAAVLQALRQIQYDGLAGHWSFDENGDSNLLLVTGRYVENGEWKSIGLLRVR